MILNIKNVAVNSAIVLLLCVSSVSAKTINNKPFAGVDLQSVYLSHDSDVDFLDLDHNLGAFSIFGGYRWENIGVEAGITAIRGVNYVFGSVTHNGITIFNANLKQRNFNTYVDGLFFLPVTKNLELKALAGVGLLTTELSGNFTVNRYGIISSKSDSEHFSTFGARLGLGLQYNFDDDISISLMYKFQSVNDFVKNLQIVSLGASYYF